ncbi:DHHC palmitoyltransferase-domain-containing protein [Naematelia encephala]|uniref:Palmitoyltransferase n=1 Tax=Naematelia encephala TaxID=71784 RepID=A0A1Y2AQA0_9TREE|nr:DHHC palmitoyltransferase-domain-containing protein [Naematelia encephala]
MPLLRSSSALVIRCFKSVENCADWITGAAGPVFVTLAWLLIVAGGIGFFDVIARQLPIFLSILLSPIFFLVPLNLYGQYYLVTHVPPGFPSSRAMGLSPHRALSTDTESRWLVPKPSSIFSAERWGLGKRGMPLSGMDGYADIRAQGKRVRRCRKCDGPKPERTHHCSVCKRCVLMMDHHCPWINACVGLHNQRHFVLFMAWLSIACWTVGMLGFKRFWESFDYHSPWPCYTPRIVFTLVYVLALAIGIAVPVLMSWHLYMVSNGETSIESHDNDYLGRKAKAEGLIYLNPYDLGRRRNLETFFNIGPNGYPMTTLLFPLLIPPASNGWSFPRRPLPSLSQHRPTVDLHSPELSAGLMSSSAEHGHASHNAGGYVMGDEDGLTDDEEGGGGWMD